MSPDKLCEKYLGKEKLDLKISIKGNMILIEGQKSALEFLGKLLIVQSSFKDDCGFHIGPRQAGSRAFSKKSKYGVYIHRLPCMSKKRNMK